jgi:UDP-GlcNAc:undecaprenyl-phosphate GlcNAc-1-phosphate transferase
MPPDELDAVVAAAAAGVVTAAVTPLVGRLARRLGAMDEPRDRGLSRRLTPLLGGVAIFAGVLLAALVWLPLKEPFPAILGGAAIITLVGAVDDVLDLDPALKLAGQVAAVAVPVSAGVVVTDFTLPFVHRVELGDLGAPEHILQLAEFSLQRDGRAEADDRLL